MSSPGCLIDTQVVYVEGFDWLEVISRRGDKFAEDIAKYSAVFVVNKDRSLGIAENLEYFFVRILFPGSPEKIWPTCVMYRQNLPEKVSYRS